MKLGTFVFICGAIFSIVFFGCSGSIKGIIRRDAVRIPITYTDSRIGKGVLQTVLPDGESFEGQLLKASSMNQLEPTNSVESSRDILDFPAIQSFEGNAEATLAGNRGRIIKCRFKLSDTVIGLSSGGFGVCQVSDSRVIDIFY